ncbi:MAG: GntR family transcriptional regulator [Alistipes sp.]|nr:GntR family transcriptional regulator [Alistipes sp.]
MNQYIFDIDTERSVPIYKQLLAQVETAINEQTYKPGQCLPSMNELSQELNISKETVKKVYAILRDRGLIDSMQGKGFFVSQKAPERRMKVFMLLDKLSLYKQVFYDAFVAEMNNTADITINLYSQNIDLFEEFIDKVLDDYDYYIVTPHFPLDSSIQHRALKALKRIPNRKLIIADHWPRMLQGNYGVVYQDQATDSYECLRGCIDELKCYDSLHVVAPPTSLYGSIIIESVERLCREYGLTAEYHNEVSSEIIHRGQVYLVITGQLGLELVDMIRLARTANLEVGKDIGIISYNESYISEIILNGLTTLSTDFTQMGAKAAQMILSHRLCKVKCDSRIIRRATF